MTPEQLKELTKLLWLKNAYELSGDQCVMTYAQFERAVAEAVTEARRDIRDAMIEIVNEVIMRPRSKPRSEGSRDP